MIVSSPGIFLYSTFYSLHTLFGNFSGIILREDERSSISLQMVAVDVIFMTGLFSILICILIVLSCLRYIKYVDKEDSEVKLRSVCENREKIMIDFVCSGSDFIQEPGENLLKVLLQELTDFYFYFYFRANKSKKKKEKMLMI